MNVDKMSDQAVMDTVKRAVSKKDWDMLRAITAQASPNNRYPKGALDRVSDAVAARYGRKQTKRLFDRILPRKEQDVAVAGEKLLAAEASLEVAKAEYELAASVSADVQEGWGAGVVRAGDALAKSRLMREKLDAAAKGDLARIAEIDKLLYGLGVTPEAIHKMHVEEVVALANSVLSPEESRTFMCAGEPAVELGVILEQRLGVANATALKHRTAYFTLLGALPNIVAGAKGHMPSFTAETVATLSYNDIMLLYSQANSPEVRRAVIAAGKADGTAKGDVGIIRNSIAEAHTRLAQVLSVEATQALERNEHWARMIGGLGWEPSTFTALRRVPIKPSVTSGPPISHNTIRDKCIRQVLGVDLYDRFEIQAGDPVVPFEAWKVGNELRKYWLTAAPSLSQADLEPLLLECYTYAMFHQGHRRTFHISEELLKGLQNSNVENARSMFLRLPYPAMCIEFPIGNNMHFTSGTGDVYRLSCAYCVEDGDLLTITLAGVAVTGAHETYCPVVRYNREAGGNIGDLIRSSLASMADRNIPLQQRETRVLLRVVMNAVLVCNGGSNVEVGPLQLGPTTQKLLAHPKKNEEWKRQLRRASEREPIIIDVGKHYKYPVVSPEERERGVRLGCSYKFVTAGHWKPKLSARVGRDIWVEPYIKNPNADWLHKDYKVIDSTKRKPARAPSVEDAHDGC